MLFGICHTTNLESVPLNLLLFGKFCHTRNLESGFGKIIVWQIRIWYRISTDIIVYAKQYPDGDDRYDYLVLH
jgi:hypothetical protein